MITIVYAANRYHDQDPASGDSFEHVNFYDSLRRMEGVRLVYFPYDIIRSVGPVEMNTRLLETIKKEKPDLFFTTMPYEQLDKGVLRAIQSLTISVGWFGDDHWHFDNCSKYFAPYMTWIVTTYSRAVPKYRALGFTNVIHSQLAANHWRFHPPDLPVPPRYDVSFIGAWYPHRGSLVRFLERAGMRIAVWGPGWPAGRLPDSDAPRVFWESKINLDINPPSSYIGLKPFARFFFKREGDAIRHDLPNFFGNVREWWQKRIPLIKSRTFNCLASRGFMITQATHDLHDYYDVGREIVAFSSPHDLLSKIKYYLIHESERAAIASAGYKRTIRDHTYEKRFAEIFRKVGLRRR